MLNVRPAVCAIVVAAFVMHVFGEDTVAVNQPTNNQVANEPKIKFSGNGWSMIGEIMKGTSTSGNGEGSNLDHAWIQTSVLELGVKADINDNTRVILDGWAEEDYTYELNSALINKDFAADQKVSKIPVGIQEAEGIYTVGGNDSKTFPFQIGVGVFPYKYNPDVRNLGEYLFRASAYPVYFMNWYDAAFYRMTGVRASTSPVDWFKFDALLFSEMYQIPLRDFSLACVATFNVGKFLELGCGIDINRILPVNNSYTSPGYSSNSDINCYSKDSVGIDSLTGQIVYGNQKDYSFKSTKVELRLSFDPKSFIPLQIFGKEDLKLYGEYAILGLQNYATHNVSNPAFYDTLSQRSPVMLGFNIPAFKILDVLSFEIEYLKTPYLPGSYNVFLNQSPVPVTLGQQNLSLADTKWSLYAKRTLGAFGLVVQVARDHFQPNNNQLTAVERADVLLASQDWWWSMKVQYGF
jgi:hypothetical protein